MAETSIIVTECRQVHTGTGRNGKEYRIYEVQATRPDRTPIENMKLRSFQELPLGEVLEVNVEKFDSEQYGTSYTISRKGSGGGGGSSSGGTVSARAFSDALQRIGTLEETVTKLARRVYGEPQQPVDPPPPPAGRVNTPPRGEDPMVF